ncbi:MAG: alanine racemase [Actinobacteria bacterium]|nr:alanine racemase [Actinomycetota bacterium]
MSTPSTDEALRRPNWMRVDRDVLRANYEEIVRRSGDRRVVASVKADGYGHGVLDVSRALADAGCDSLWTGHIGDALAIRAAGIDTEVVLFGGYTPDQIPALVAAGLVPTVVDLTGAAAAASCGAAVYVKVDAGLGRLGVPVDVAGTVIREMAGLDGITIAGIYTHLPFSDRAGREWAVSKGAVFTEMLDGLARDGVRPGFTQMWGTCGLLADLPDATNAVCVGHALYGMSPFTDPTLTDAELQPVLTELGASLIHVADHPHDVRAGGYLTRGVSRVGVIPFGVTDGMRRVDASFEPHALVRGQRVPIVGTSLEHTVLDLAAVPDAAVGDRVVLVGRDGGQHITLTEWATSIGCSELDAVLAVAGRVQRRLAGA